jgi:hypothetical protein
VAILTFAFAGIAAAQASARLGPGLLTGVWVKVNAPFGIPDREEMFTPRASVMTTADGSPTPLQPWAAEIVEKRLVDAEAGRPFADTKSQCLPGGVPDMVFGSGPMQFLESPGQVTILRQELSYFRIIRLNGKHESNPDPTFTGDGVGRWQGDTLVVDTIALTPRTTIKGVIPHTDKLRVVERFKLVGKDRMDVVATIDDAGAFTKTWTMKTELVRLDDQLMEYYCENNRNAATASGHIGNGVTN